MAFGMFEIQVQPGVPAQTLTTTLDGVKYRLTLTWNERQERWHMSIALTDGTIVRSGLRLPPYYFVSSTRRDGPPGRFLVLEDSGAKELPSLNEFGPGTRFGLFYVAAI